MGREDPAPWTLALFVVVGCLAFPGCDSRPPPPPQPDGGPRRDAGAASDGAIDAGGGQGRPDGGPRLPAADREVVLTYFGDTVTEDLEVSGEVGRLDVFFSIDTTGSFTGEIDNLQSDLRTRIVPELRARVDDVAFGVGRFEDFPTQPFGAATDHPFVLLSPITLDDDRLAGAVASLDMPIGDGADVPESGAEALYQIATGEGHPGIVPSFHSGPIGNVGGVGFRGDALRTVVHVTDAPTHETLDYRGQINGTHTLDEAIDALHEHGIRVLGVASGPAARSYLETAALATGASSEPLDGECETGVNGAPHPASDGRCPLVFDINEDGSGLTDAIVDAIADLLASVQYEEVWAETDDRLGFVRRLEAVDATVGAGVPRPTLADRRPSDGVDDTFLGVRPGTHLTFRATLRNETIPPEDYDQIYNLVIRVVGDGVTLIERRIRVIVPRGRLDAGTPDAGGPDAGDAGEFDAGGLDAGGLDAGDLDAGDAG